VDKPILERRRSRGEGLAEGLDKKKMQITLL
jgi:hypothetical protein